MGARLAERAVLDELVERLRLRRLVLAPVLDLGAARLITADIYGLGESLAGILHASRPVWTGSRRCRVWLPAAWHITQTAQRAAAAWRVMLGPPSVLDAATAGRFGRELDAVLTQRRAAIVTLSRAAGHSTVLRRS